jgi:hypothetical protein
MKWLSELTVVTRHQFRKARQDGLKMRYPWSATEADSIGEMEQVNFVKFKVVKLIVEVESWEEGSAKPAIGEVGSAPEEAVPISDRHIFSFGEFVEYVSQICIKIKSI